MSSTEVYERPNWTRGLAAAAVMLAGLMGTGCNNQTAGPPAAAGTAEPEVGIVTIQPERVVLTTELPGRITSYLVAEIRPQVNGLIQRRLFVEGANVKAGDLLYQIDPAPYEAVLQQAKAALATAEADLVTAEANLPALRSRLQRLEGLVKINAVARQDYDDASAAVKQAEANLAARRAGVEINRAAVETARINLSYTPIKAPISGRIGMSNITVGAMATAYQPTPLAVIQQLDPIYVDVAQANADLLRLRKQMESGTLKRNRSTQSRVTLVMEDGTPYPLPGVLQFRDVTVDPTTGSMTLRIVFRNPKLMLLPGMFVRAVVEEGVQEQALMVPQQGVARDRKGLPYALVVNEQGQVEQKILTLERALGDRWLVTGGIAPGDRVIVEGAQRVRPGAQVRAAAMPAGGGQ